MTRLAILQRALIRFGTPQQLARAGGFSASTAYRYQSGLTVPDILTMTRLMSISREITDAVLEMAGLDDRSLDVEYTRLLRSVAELERRREERNAALQALVAPTAGANDAPPSHPLRRATDRVAGPAAATHGSARAAEE